MTRDLRDRRSTRRYARVRLLNLSLHIPMAIALHNVRVHPVSAQEYGDVIRAHDQPDQTRAARAFDPMTSMTHVHTQ